MGNYTENVFVVDLSKTNSTAELAAELNSVLECCEDSSKSICLNLGELELKQSQLLSIKALIESMGSSIASIITNSVMTEASATSLGIEMFTDELQATVKDSSCESNAFEEETEEVEEKIEEDTFEQPEFTITPEVDEALDTVLGVQNSDTSEINIEPKTIEFDFEVSDTTEQSSKGKYILLDTEGITSDDYEENTDNTAEHTTMYSTQTLRSGQRISYDGNVLIVGDTHPGSEVIATGDITVWGILGGIAHAGSGGNVNAKVRALKLNPIQLRIAGLYSRRNDTINVPFVQRSNEFTPEEARIYNKQIMVYKTLRRED